MVGARVTDRYPRLQEYRESIVVFLTEIGKHARGMGVEQLRAAKIDRVLNHEGWFTLFCPTNEGFAREKFYPGEDTMLDKMRMHVARGKECCAARARA